MGSQQDWVIFDLNELDNLNICFQYKYIECDFILQLYVIESTE